MKNRIVMGLLWSYWQEEITFQEKKGDESNEINVWESPIIVTASHITGLLQTRTQVRTKLCRGLFNTSGLVQNSRSVPQCYMNETDETALIKKSQAHFSHTAVLHIPLPAAGMPQFQQAENKKFQSKKSAWHTSNEDLLWEKNRVFWSIKSHNIFTIYTIVKLFSTVQESPDTWYCTVAKQNLFFCKCKGLQH